MAVRVSVLFCWNRAASAAADRAATRPSQAWRSGCKALALGPSAWPASSRMRGAHIRPPDSCTGIDARLQELVQLVIRMGAERLCRPNGATSCSGTAGVDSGRWPRRQRRRAEAVRHGLVCASTSAVSTMRAAKRLYPPAQRGHRPTARPSCPHAEALVDSAVSRSSAAAILAGATHDEDARLRCGEQSRERRHEQPSCPRHGDGIEPSDRHG